LSVKEKKWKFLKIATKCSKAFFVAPREEKEKA